MKFIGKVLQFNMGNVIAILSMVIYFAGLLAMIIYILVSMYQRDKRDKAFQKEVLAHLEYWTNRISNKK